MAADTHERDAKELARLLLYGATATRRAVAVDLAAQGAHEQWLDVLVATVRSGDTVLMRARCLEMLGVVLGATDTETAQRILDALVVPPQER